MGFGGASLPDATPAAHDAAMPSIRAALDLRPSARTPLMTPALGAALLAAFGGTAVLAGLRRRGPVGLAVAAAGGAIAYRGLTGSSLADRLVDVRTVSEPRLAIGPRGWSLDDDGALVVRRSITIAGTSDAVDAILVDPASLAVLSPSIDAS